MNNLDKKRFKTSNQYQGDEHILWLYKDYSQKRFLKWDFNERLTYVSWFKKDGALTLKNNFAHLINTTMTKEDKSCMPSTYDLDTHHACFIGDWQIRNQKGADNTWIIKPYDLSHSIDTWITNNPEQVSRLVECGPKIA